MIQRLIPYIIGWQFCIGFFHAGIGLWNWINRGFYDSQTLFLLCLALGTYLIYRRISGIPMWERSFSIIFQHAVFIAVISWFFYEPWWYFWEIFLMSFFTINIILSLVFTIIESQMHIKIGWGNWWIPDIVWKFGNILTLLNTITIPLIYVILHENLSIIWIFFGINWVFLWKENNQEIN